METIVIAAADFISRGLIKSRLRDKKIFASPELSERVEDSAFHLRFSFAIQGLRLFFPADATVYLSCAQRAGRFG
jgi:hypothetical protein